jgi:hypothetical protein
VACVATALLATDVLYVLTTGLDWGPVALQHLFLIAGALLLFSFHKSGKRLHLGAAFLLFGLGLWDKAVFFWPLAGLTVAAIVVFPRELLAKLRLRNLAAAAVAFVIGAAPLISYNQAAGGKTLHDNGGFSTARFGHKFLELQKSLEGSCLFGYIVREDVPLEAAKPRNAIEKFSMDLSEATGHRRAGVLALACILAFALLPWFWNTPARKPMLFALVFSVATWLQMACTWKAGGGAHHTVLLWPFPHLFVAAALAQASRYLGRAGLPALVAVTAAICGINLLVLNEHFAQIVERGTTPAWSDATGPLSAYLRHTEPKHVYVTDWGIAGSLRLLNEGKLPLEVAADRFLRAGGGQLPAPALGAQGAIFVGHTEGNEVTGGVALPLEELARSAGLHKRVIRVIDDRVGRPTFEIYRFAR